jgi:hypothetical protein
MPADDILLSGKIEYLILRLEICVVPQNTAHENNDKN